jgi:hypothetical protein
MPCNSQGMEEFSTPLDTCIQAECILPLLMITLWNLCVQIPVGKTYDHHLTQTNVYRIYSNPSLPTAITLTRATIVIFVITGSFWEKKERKGKPCEPNT